MTKITQAPFITPGAGTGLVVTDSLAIGRIHYNDLVHQLAQDIQGLQGTQGSSTGNTGAQGMYGVQGLRGSQGTVGRTGTGAQGIAGSAAAQGVQGRQGAQGVQGAQGLGLQGRQGISGSAVAQGSQGLTGTGSQGVQGVQGAGSQGVQGTISPTAGSANQVIYKNASNIASGSEYLIFDGAALYSYTMVSARQNGAEGGYFNLFVPASGHTLNGAAVIIDVYANTLRVYESGSPKRGGYIDITKLSADASTNLLGVGVGQAWSDNLSPSGTSERTLSSSYRNTSGQPISVQAGASVNGSYMFLYYSTNNTDWITLDQTYGAGGATGVAVKAIIPDSGYYKVECSNLVAWSFWHELR